MSKITRYQEKSSRITDTRTGQSEKKDLIEPKKVLVNQGSFH